ncbi:unnamed protein product [Clonostachys rosea f. rosea IK726]|uniref:Heterokaryon incompatibility domain-containing protein n=2 Tax=Bionectria ochroleuca TaxID=29856 RepID=A0A0B7K5H6_BIOOC|nr:unnamed protein product [Clonostachys rosea f. rosea IK726]
MADVRKHHVHRAHMTAVHDHCPDRAYIELEVPQDAAEVVSVTFTSVSRDQGWADSREASFTWFMASVRRPLGRSSLRTIGVMSNDPGVPEFREHTVRWSAESGARRWTWLQALRSGDVIQLIPKAKYLAWTNIIKECRIDIEYKPAVGVVRVPSLVTAQEYHYSKPLDPEVKEIRLLVVQPAEEVDDELELSWLSASLTEDLNFSALSYCWGDSTQTVDVNISVADQHGTHKRPFRAGRTVVAAIRRLRSKEESLMIWIDAICVNQADPIERSQQVALMREIYSFADKVHIWLGEDRSIVNTALRLVRNISNYNSRACPGGDACQCTGTRHSIELKLVDDLVERKQKAGEFVSWQRMDEVFDIFRHYFSPDEVDWAGGQHGMHLQIMMSALFSHPWFTRVWVVQEATLARQAFLYSSEEMVTWDEVAEVNGWIGDLSYQLQTQHIQSEILMAPIWKDLRAAVNGRQTTAAFSDYLPNILDVFIAGHDLRSTDPRDKVFALLTFGKETNEIQDLDELIKPDYRKSTAQVYADFTRWWIKENRSLAILSAIHSQTARTWQRTSCDTHVNVPDDNQPTWAVHGEGLSRWATASLQKLGRFHAASSREVDVTLLQSSEPLVLDLSGRRVSRISALGHIPMELFNPYTMDMDERPDLPFVIDKILDPCGYTGFWSLRTVFSEKENTRARGQREYGDHLNSHWAYLPQPALQALFPSWAGEVQYEPTQKLTPCLESCFFVTEDGQWGLCPWMAKAGDVIVLLDGGDIPYLLRRKPDSEGASTKFEFIGECFVESIMHGEYLTRPGVEEETEVFSIV